MVLAQWWITSLSTEISMVLSMAMVLMITDLGRMCELYLRKQKQRKKLKYRKRSFPIMDLTGKTVYMQVLSGPSITHLPKVKLSMGQIRSIVVQIYLHYGSDLYLTNDIARHASRSPELTQIKFRWWVYVSIRLKRCLPESLLDECIFIRSDDTHEPFSSSPGTNFYESFCNWYQLDVAETSTNQLTYFMCKQSVGSHPSSLSF